MPRPQTFEEWQKTSVGEYCTTVAKLAEEKAPNLAVEDKLRLAFNSGKRAASTPKVDRHG